MEPKLDNNRSTEASHLQAEKFIIGIGASAGGMEAIHELFDYTPTDAVSYVIVQHLSPDHKSFMKELLIKHSKLKIHVAENGMEVKSNCVYVLPEGKNMTISKGNLILKDRPGSTPNSAIDIFFNALAEDLGNKSIGIVLSGNGADGTKGIEAIKKEGGMVIVQDPASTDYKDMPKNAIASGYYDYILAPKLIPLQIVKYIKQKTLIGSFSFPLSDINDAALSKIHGLIKNSTPLDFSEYKQPTIIRRITRRMLARDVENIGDYIEILKSSPEEIEILSNDFLISVTTFFRNREAFEVISKKVIPDLVEQKLLVDILKVWVIGCATGEEAYSLAILIKEYLIEVKKDMEVKIFASDIDQEALNKASKGCYPESISKDVSERRLNLFFTKEGHEYKVKDAIRKMVIFAKQDIIHQPPYGKIDLISCRNLMIYFNPTLQKKIFATINYCLNAEGYLFLGPSEGIGDLKKVFIEIDKKWNIYKNTEENREAPFYAFDPKRLKIKKHSYTSRTLKSRKINLTEKLPTLLHLSTLEETAYSAGVGVDENFQVTLSFGNIEKFLLPRLFNNQLLELLPNELSIATGSSIKKATRENINVRLNDITFMSDDQVRSVNILVKPLMEEDKTGQRMVFIYFAEGEAKNNSRGKGETFDLEKYAESYVKELEQELAETKQRLQEAYESIEESQHDIQSYNEELLSGNEEMQSYNEELQSMNEELNTVNQEYQTKIKELAELNDDLDNYFKSTHITQIYVDQNIILKKYNPITVKQINIKESDIGRPLADISTNIIFSTLIEDIKYVIDNQVGREKDIETTDGRWYSMLIVPYIRSQDNKANGAILTFNDITEMKRTNFIIQEANRKLLEINKEHDTFIYAASHDLRAPLNNMEGLLDHIRDSGDLEEVKTYTVPLIESVIRLKDTIAELSKIAWIDQEIEMYEKVNLLQLLKEVKLSINDSLVKSGAKIWVDLKEPSVYYSKKNLRSIFLNLLSNAVKYRSADRELSIVIKSKRVDHTFVLSFEDNGIGIKEDKIGELFSKFKRVHDDKINVEGSGLGLYLIKKIITNTGGSIGVESSYNHGTIFTITLVETVNRS